MARNRVVLLRDGYDAFRNSGPVVELLEQVAEQIRDRAQSNVDGNTSDRPFTGDKTHRDITVDVVHNSSRAVAFVATDTLRGHHAEAANRALNRAIG